MENPSEPLSLRSTIRSPVVSVLIPAYNMDRFVGRAIDSVLNGSVEDVEVLVIDDGSQDRTADIVKRYTDTRLRNYDPRVRYVRQENQGKSSALNLGLHLFQGAYLTILDADDTLPDHGLASRLQQAEKGPALVIGGFSVVNEEGEEVGRRMPPSATTPSLLRNRYFYSFRTPFHLCATLIRRDLVSKVGSFDETLDRCDDLDYALRLLRSASSIGIVDEAVYHYRKYRDRVSERVRYRWTTLLERPLVYKRHAPTLQIPSAVLAGVVADLGKGLYEMVVGNYRR